MRPLRVTAHLVRGVAFVAGEGLSLDGPLLYATLVEERGADFFAGSPDTAEIADATAVPHPRMPLAAHGLEGEDWIYRASMATLQGWAGSGRHHWHKRFDEALAGHLIDAGGVDISRKSRVQTNSGEFRSYRMPLQIEHCERLVWWVIGEADRMRRLLERHVESVGKKQAAGWGTVGAWEVQEDEEALKRWRDRPIPLSLLTENEAGREREIRSIRPPHWCTAHWRECGVPAQVAREVA